MAKPVGGGLGSSRGHTQGHKSQGMCIAGASSVTLVTTRVHWPFLVTVPAQTVHCQRQLAGRPTPTQTPQETTQGFQRNPMCDSEHSGRQLSCAGTYSKVAHLCLIVNGANVTFHVFWDPPSLSRSGLHVQPGEAQCPLRCTDSFLSCSPCARPGPS